ncbi:MAG TPA: response regulator, partial [Rhodothermales bacterium]|nr:response regulator [Rhodothermales bacterium]
MVKQVLAFARGVQGDRVPLRPELVVREVEKMAEETFPGNIEVQVDLADDLHLVQGDATQLQQVLMNLCVNARDAMPDGGTLSIQVANLTIDATMARANLEAKPGKYVKLSVSDTGEGIPPAVLDKVFEPFFTTKPVGKGTGLGLSTVYSILKSHNGFASVHSQVGQGTTFDIFLPASVNAEVPDEDDGIRAVRDGHGELVLLVDDEDFIRETGQEILENAGYRVATAADGKEALAICAQQADDMAVVITDIMMPEMDGIELIRTLRRDYPHLPIIAASGMADSQSQAALDAGAQTFLSKPFTADVLYSTLDDVLESV